MPILDYEAASVRKFTPTTDPAFNSYETMNILNFRNCCYVSELFSLTISDTVQSGLQ